MKTIETRSKWIPSEQVLKKNKQVLKTLALEGPLTIPKMASRAGLPKSTIYEAIYGTSKSSTNKDPGLLADDKICVVSEISWRTGLPMRTYGLTCEGLYKVLDDWDDKQLWAKIDDVAKNWGHFIPFIFNRWDFFKKFGLIENVLSALRWYVGGKHAMGIPNSRDYLKYSEEDFDDFLYSMFHQITYAHSMELSRKWVDALRNDDELRKMSMRYYMKALGLANLEIEAISLNLEVIRLIENPESDSNQLERVMTMLNEIETRLNTERYDY
jgi:hypothetical protein